MFKSVIERTKRALGLSPKDFSIGSDDYKKMLDANLARTEESGEVNTKWTPGALNRLKKKERLDRWRTKWNDWKHRDNMVYQSKRRVKEK